MWYLSTELFFIAKPVLKEALFERSCGREVQEST